MKTYLVTGAAGFIGSNLAKKLLDLGNTVVTIDNLSTGYESAIPSGVIFIKGDCADEKIIMQLYKYYFDAIFHIAGQSSGEISFENPVYDLQTNAQSTLLLLQLARKIKCKDFIYASTMSVYGKQDDKPISENAIIQPKSFYGVGKISSEYYLKIYEQFGIKSTALRLFNVYGPGQNLLNLKQGMVSIFMAQVINDNKIHVKGSKDRFRDFVYIDDVVNSFLLCLQRPSNLFAVYNICTNKKTKIHELINIIKSNFNKDIPVEYTGNTLGDQFGIVGDNKAAKNNLHWQPKIELKKGIKMMFKWVMLNK